MRTHQLFAPIVFAVVGATAWLQTESTKVDTIVSAAATPAKFASGGVDPRMNREAFSIDVGLALLAELPVDRKLLLKSIGDDEDQKIATEVQRYLERNGYDVLRIMERGGPSPPLRRFEISSDPYGCTLTVAPSARSVSG